MSNQRGVARAAGGGAGDSGPRGDNRHDRDTQGSVTTRDTEPSMPDPRHLELLSRAGYELIKLNRWDKAPDGRGRGNGKTPLENGWTTRTYNLPDLKKHMEHGGNVGVRLKATDLVVDVDPRNFEEGDDPVSRLENDFDIQLADNVSVVTGGGGLHIYMRKPAEVRVRGKLPAYAGIEFKSAGSYVVAPGSLHPETGRRYSFDVLSYLPAETKDVPTGLLDALARDGVKPLAAEAVEAEPEELTLLLEALDPANYRDYHDWFQIMAACHHFTGGLGAEEFIEWSTSDPPYVHDDADVRKAWDSLRLDHPDPVTARTLFNAVVKAGRPGLVEHHIHNSAEGDFADAGPLTPDEFDKYRTDEDGAASRGRIGSPSDGFTGQRRLERYKDGGIKRSFGNCLILVERKPFGLAYDEVAQRHFLTASELPWQQDVGREVSDDVVRTIRHYLLEQDGVEFSKDNVIEACLTLARQHSFNPVADYLDSLEWDGEARIGTWLSDYLGADSDDFAHAIGRIVLVAAVRRARQPGCKFDNVLILEGEQGTGKSTALKVLGGEWFSDAELGRVDSKEAPQILQGVWIHELGELTALSRIESEALKGFVSRVEDRYRAPYERVPRSVPRRCIFIGTTNHAAYLSDQTGNRRFWPVRTGRIDLDALRRDSDQLWAEAVAAEAAGEPIELSHDLYRNASEEQDQRLVADPWVDDITRYLDIHKCDRVHSRDLMEYALEIEPGRKNQAGAKRLRQVMAGLGWTYKKAVRIGDRSGSGYVREPDRLI